MTDTSNHRGLLTGIAGCVVGVGLGAAAGVWWGRRIPGHIFRDGDDWYVDEPVLRELQRRMQWSGGLPGQGGYTFSLFGHGAIKLVPTSQRLPEQSGGLYAVQPMLSKGQELMFVMLDLAIHRVGKLKLIRYTPLPVHGRMVQGPGVGPDDSPVGNKPPGLGG